MSKPKNFAAIDAIAVTIVSLIFGFSYYSKIKQYDEFISFKNIETKTPIQVKIKQMSLVPNKKNQMKVENYNGEIYFVNLLSLNEKQLELLQNFDFTDSQLMYFSYNNKKCLVGILKNNMMIIKGDSVSTNNTDFNYFKNYHYYCDSI